MWGFCWRGNDRDKRLSCCVWYAIRRAEKMVIWFCYVFIPSPFFFLCSVCLPSLHSPVLSICSAICPSVSFHLLHFSFCFITFFVCVFTSIFFFVLFFSLYPLFVSTVHCFAVLFLLLIGIVMWSPICIVICVFCLSFYLSVCPPLYIFLTLLVQCIYSPDCFLVGPLLSYNLFRWLFIYVNVKLL